MKTLILLAALNAYGCPNYLVRIYYADRIEQVCSKNAGITINKGIARIDVGPVSPDPLFRDGFDDYHTKPNTRK